MDQLVLQEDDSHIKMENIIPFSDFSRLLEKISTTRGNPSRINQLSKFISHFRAKFKELHNTLDSSEASGDSIFPVIRLLCPTWDRERASYGIKETLLGRMFARILGIDKNSLDGQKLFKYKDPSIVGREIAGNIGSVISSVLSTRIYAGNTNASNITIHELHEVLDQLSRNKSDYHDEKTNQEKQIGILQRFIRRVNPLEGKWLSKIILKQMDLGVKETTILSLLHPKANKLLDSMGLEEVCQICNDPTAEGVPVGKIQLFRFFKPMLCLQLKLGNEGTRESPKLKIISQVKKTSLQLPPAPFLVETKFDGERFQIHYELDESGQSIFRYFSRRNFEHPQFNETLTPKLSQLLVKRPVVKSFILDGEMMAYNLESQNFTTKGENIDVKSLIVGGSHCPAFVAWDLVYFNGESLCDQPLETRAKLLEKVLHTKESTYYISKQIECSSLEEVVTLLDEAIENCEEGIVIKDRNSLYEIGQRKAAWLKLKPEYVDGCRVDDLDLLIIGGYFAERKSRMGKITKLLLGIRDGKDIYPLTRVGCGRLKHKDMASLVNSLQPYFVKEEIKGFKIKGKRPDVFIDPKHSIVLQVNASEIIVSKDLVLNYSLRFPVVQKVRRDKSWDDILTVSEFHDLRLSLNKGKLVQKRSPVKSKKEYFSEKIDFDESSEDESNRYVSKEITSREASTSNIYGVIRRSNRKKTGIKTKQVSPSKLRELVDIAEVTKSKRRRLSHIGSESKIFEGKCFQLLGTSTWKSKIQEKLENHGGHVVLNPTVDLYVIIAEKMSDTVKNKMEVGKWNIVEGETWIDKCIDEKKVCPFLPNDLLFASEEIQAEFASKYDTFGIPLMEKVSPHQLKLILEKIVNVHILPELRKLSPSKSKGSVDEILKQQMREVFDEDDQEMSRRHLFQDCKFSFYPNVIPYLKYSIQFFGGTVISDWNSEEVTHIIFEDQANPTNEQPYLSNTTAVKVSSRRVEICIDTGNLSDLQ